MKGLCIHCGEIEHLDLCAECGKVLRDKARAEGRREAHRTAVAAIDKRIALSEPGSDRLSLTYLRREIVAMAREEA